LSSLPNQAAQSLSGAIGKHQISSTNSNACSRVADPTRAHPTH